MMLISVLVATLVTSPTPETPRAVIADTFTVTGTITDRQTNRPVPLASVRAPDYSAQTRADSSGHYRLAIVVAPGTHSVNLVFRSIGYTQFTHQVFVNGSGANVNVALAPVQQQLSAVIVSGEMTRAQRKAVGTMAPMGMTVSIAPGAARDQRTGNGHTGAIPRDSANREQYANLVENPFQNAVRTPLSTFSIDVDRASYSDVRRFLDQGSAPRRDAVRIEELVNYFRYDYAAPTDNTHPLNVTVETHPAPWQPLHRPIRIGMQAPRLPLADLPPANLVFLIDVSGSMHGENRLPLVIKSLRLLTAELRAQDRVAIAVYAGAAGLVLPSTLGSDKATIFAALDRLQAGGSTNGAAGIRLAYQTAREHFLTNGANRVILATDGDFNVGTTSDSDLIQLIESERKSGVFLTVLGFGMGNTQHAKMEQLADKGNGQYAYIDDLAEAQKALVREMGGTLFTLAKDVKIQVEFNPARVRSYRLIGYENRLLADQDFNDDAKDAGELGAGHSVTALYEVELTDGPATVNTGSVDPSRYTTTTRQTPRKMSEELAFVKVRYQAPHGGASKLLQWAVRESAGAPTQDFTFASAVAAFGMLLRNSDHKGNITWPDVRRLAESGLGADTDGDRAGFLRLVTVAERVMTTTAAVTRER
jgi:Ca-activated chloride channel homolog